jgi:hypothetical protein
MAKPTDSKPTDSAKSNPETAGLCEADVAYVADVAAPMVPMGKPLRPLSTRERELLAASRRDFAEGRTLTMEEWRASTDAAFARYRAAE